MADKLHEEKQKLFSELKDAVEAKNAEALDRINTRFDEIEAKMRAEMAAANRPSAGKAEDAAEVEYKTAFNTYVRTGNHSVVRGLQTKAMTATAVDNSGFVTVPTELAATLRQSLVNISPARQLFNVETSNTPNFSLPFATGGTGSVWVGEKDARNATNTDTITEVNPTFGEIWARPTATQQLVEDSQYDIQAFIAQRTVQEFARQEGAAFMVGDGSKKPTGLLNVTTAATTDDAGRAFGTVQYIPSGAAANFASSNPADVLFNLVMSLKAGYRANASFIMNKATLGVVRTMKDGQQRYLWEPALTAGAPSVLLGYPVYESEDMPGIAANATPISFGDHKQAYTIVDRVGLSIQYDPLTAVPYIAWNVRKRVGGCPVDTQAYKLLKIAAS